MAAARKITAWRAALALLLLLAANAFAQTDPLASWNGWLVVSMKDDWKRIFAFEP